MATPRRNAGPRGVAAATARTADGRPPARPGAAEPSVRARALYGLNAVAERNGGDATKLLVDVGIDPSRLTDPDYPVPGVAVARLFENAARELDAPDFGLQLAEYHDASILGTVALVVLNSRTLGAALEAIANNIQFHNPSASVRVTADARRGVAVYEHDPGLGDDVPRRQAVEMIFAIVFRMLRMLTGSTGADWRVRFRHARGATLRQYRRHFSCPIEFGHDRDCIEFPSRLLAQPIDHADPNLRALSARYLGQLQRRYPSDLRGQVAELVRRQLPNGGGQAARIGEILGLHPKTLQRRLRAENTSFERITDEVRRSLAEEYLVFSFLPLSEVAALVGYSGQTAFIVACRRWFGTTPKRYRAQFMRRTAKAPAPRSFTSPGTSPGGVTP
ncbi:MAG: AraC family transcriptional regulator [Steroidobacteraceae bacterium]